MARIPALGRSAVPTVLQGARAGRVVAFLDDMDDLLPYAAILEGVDLSGAELKGVDFGG